MNQEQIKQAIEALQSIDLAMLNNENTVSQRIKNEINNRVQAFNEFLKTHELMDYGVTFEDFTVLRGIDKKISIDQYIFEQGFRFLNDGFGSPDVYEMEMVIDGASQIAKEYRDTCGHITKLNELLYGSKK